MKHLASCLSCVALSLVVAASARAQGEGEAVHELKEVTADGLIDILQPKNAPLTRGLTVAPPSEQPPNCGRFRDLQEAGVESPPVSDIAAVTIQFAVDSDRVSDEAGEVLGALAEALRSDRLSRFCFRLEGHTDSTGSAAHNLDLSRRRARSVARYLSERLGVEGDRLVVAGYGAGRPLATNDTAEGRQRNRRVQIMNLGAAPAGG